MMTIRGRRICLSTLLLLVLGCAGGLQEGHLNVVLIVVDTLRADALGCYGAAGNPTPQIDLLASRGVRFDRCISQAPWTLPSIATILTGLYPSAHGTRSFSSILPEDLRTMTRDFRSAGYATGAVVSHRFVTRQKGFAHGFQFFDASNNKGHEYVSSAGVTEIALNWLENQSEPQSEDEPFFLFLHYFDPHYNYQEHSGFATVEGDYNGPLSPGMDIWDLREALESGNGDDIRYLRNLYEGEVRYVDNEIGRIFEYLDSRGLWENTVVVFTSDHGEEFLEHGWLGHTRNLYDNLIRVPLIISAPRLSKGTVRDDSAMLVDLYATVGRLAHLESPLNHGIDLFDGTISDRVCISEVNFDPESNMYAPRKIVAREAIKHTEMRAVERGNWKAIEDRLRGEWKLYHRGDDPGEIRDRATSNPDILHQLQSDLSNWEDSILRGRVESEVLDSSQIEELRSLGYVR